MSFDFASLTYRPGPRPVLAVVAKSSGELDPESVVELWQERSAIQQTDNLELVRWYRENGKSEFELRRACELCAAADLALAYGDYVNPIIRPHITPIPANIKEVAGSAGNTNPPESLHCKGAK